MLLVVDEAYFEYARADPTTRTPSAYRERHGLLITLRTFSKIYGLAALRVGYGIADPELIDYLNRVRLPFNVSAGGAGGGARRARRRDARGAVAPR